RDMKIPNIKPKIRIIDNSTQTTYLLAKFIFIMTRDYWLIP
ncbi:unnamed protein product, partial [marine sediment metagenome]